MTRIALGLFVVWTTCTSATPPTQTQESPKAPFVDVKPVEAKPVEAKTDEAKPVDTDLRPTYAEYLGGLRLGMTQAELLLVRPSLVPEGELRSFPPDGGPIDAIAGWQLELKDRETSVTLRSKTRDGLLRATSIGVESGSTATTANGIRLGARRSAVKKAYPKARALVEDELYAKISDHEELWFGFEEGKVSGMRLGPPTDPDDIEE